jgi:hypothetical protein
MSLMLLTCHVQCSIQIIFVICKTKRKPEIIKCHNGLDFLMI